MINLTKPQADAITHRLDVVEALFECAVPISVYKQSAQKPPEWFCDLCESLNKKVNSLKLDDANLDAMEKRALVECIEGSTLVALAEDAVWRGLMPAQHVSQTKDMLSRIADKFAGFQDERIEVPAG